jgi:hypothetical protein
MHSCRVRRRPNQETEHLHFCLKLQSSKVVSQARGKCFEISPSTTPCLCRPATRLQAVYGLHVDLLCFGQPMPHGCACVHNSRQRYSAQWRGVYARRFAATTRSLEPVCEFAQRGLVPPHCAAYNQQRDTRSPHKPTGCAPCSSQHPIAE